jgi:methylthioribulose-1-phosphate dehydratase
MATISAEHAPTEREAEWAMRVELAELVRCLHGRGWTPATSSNFSMRLSADEFLISESGIDKEWFGPQHLLRVRLDGRVESGENRRRSAETLLHAAIYASQDAGAVLHTHSVNGAVFSRFFAPAGAVMLEGYELLKAFPDITSHEVRVAVPVFGNSQDMDDLSTRVAAWMAADLQAPRSPGFLLAGHGLYAWGRTLLDAKRHLEAFENMFECELRLAALRASGPG